MADKEEQGDLGNSVSTLEQELLQLKKKLQESELSLVTGAQLSSDQLTKIQDRLYKMIDYTGKRHDWFADQCNRLMQVGLALIASGGAIAALLAKLENVSTATQFLAWMFGLALFGTGLALVYLYSNYIDYISGTHPYRKVVDVHSWYYAYRFPYDLDPNLSRSAHIAKEQVRTVGECIEAFFTKFITHAKDGLSLIREDIEQVAILLLLQRYRAQQTKKMSQWLFTGLVISTFILVLLIASYFLIPPAARPPSGNST